MADPIEIADWVLSAGWSGTDAVTATAIALRPRQDGYFGLGSGGDGFAQAKAAYAIWVGRSRDWSVFPAYRDRTYLLLLPAAGVAVTAAAAKKRGADVVQDVKDTADAAVSTARGIGDLAQSVGQVSGFLTAPGAWERIMKIGLGAGLVFLGFAYMWKTGITDRALRVVRGAGDQAADPDSLFSFLSNRWGGWKRSVAAEGARNAARARAAQTKPLVAKKADPLVNMGGQPGSMKDRIAADRAARDTAARSAAAREARGARRESVSRATRPNEDDRRGFWGSEPQRLPRPIPDPGTPKKRQGKRTT